MSEELSDIIRKGISEKTGIPLSNIMLASIHTHSGPATLGQDGGWGSADSEYCDGILIPRIIEAAEKEGLSYCTITDYIRGEKIPDGLLTYKDTLRAGQTKRTLQEWAKKKTGNTIKTPEGKMIMLRAYPHIVECAKQYAKGYIITTFTLAEVYYINQGG